MSAFQQENRYDDKRRNNNIHYKTGPVRSTPSFAFRHTGSLRRCCAWESSYPCVDEIFDASSKWLSFAQMAMLCYALTVVTWGLERWWPSLARWFVVIVLSILVNLAFDPT